MSENSKVRVYRFPTIEAANKFLMKHPQFAYCKKWTEGGKYTCFEIPLDGDSNV